MNPGSLCDFGSGRRLWPALVAVALVVSGCGVSAQPIAEPLPPNALPPPVAMPGVSRSEPVDANVIAATTDESSPPTSRLRVWVVKDDGLMAVETDLPRGSEPETVIQALGSAAASADAETGARTIARDPLTGESLVFISASRQASKIEGEGSTADKSQGQYEEGMDQDPESVTVGLNASFGALPPSEQVLLLGQVVLSLAGAGYSSISFTDDLGNSLAVPLPDGRLLDEPASARDFAPLIVRP